MTGDSVFADIADIADIAAFSCDKKVLSNNSALYLPNAAITTSIKLVHTQTFSYFSFKWGLPFRGISSNDSERNVQTVNFREQFGSRKFTMISAPSHYMPQYMESIAFVNRFS